MCKSLSLLTCIFLLGISPLYAGGPYGVPKTGQAISYQHGDDGDYKRGAPASGKCFTDNGNNTITDNGTGLIWVKDSSCIPGGTWGKPGFPLAMNWSSAISSCEALNYAGYTDWRLPNIKELQSIIDYGRNGPAIDPVFISQSSYYWSSTAVSDGNDAAWYVLFGFGVVFSGDKSFTYYVRPVRGG
jgi:Protein of unknown function (DUF1566)